MNSNIIKWRSKRYFRTPSIMSYVRTLSKPVRDTEFTIQNIYAIQN